MPDHLGAIPPWPQPTEIIAVVDKINERARESMQRFMTQINGLDSVLYSLPEEEKDMPNPNRFGDTTTRAEVQKIRERLTETAAEARMKVKLELAEALATRLKTRLEAAGFEDIIVSFDKMGAGSRIYHYVGVFIETATDDGRWFLSGAESGSMTTPDLVAFLLGGTPVHELFFLRRGRDHWTVDHRPAAELEAESLYDDKHSKDQAAVED